MPISVLGILEFGVTVVRSLGGKVRNCSLLLEAIPM